jgi:diguanylate cyclase (GGDEF)-like protein
MLRNYIESGTLPNLPRQHKDEVGQLMTDVQSTINHLQSTIHEIDILSSMDGLTNIFNRMAGERRLAQDVARANREGLNIFIAMIDIDNFKSINDEHGHQAGDACIKHLAQELSNTIRQGDWVARWGGDEFMLALWNQDINSAKQSYERILNAVHLSPTHHNGLDIHLHISIGVKKYHPGLGIDSCINEADKMLYEVKRSGGGAVMLAD